MHGHVELAPRARSLHQLQAAAVGLRHPSVRWRLATMVHGQGEGLLGARSAQHGVVVLLHSVAVTLRTSNAARSTGSTACPVATTVAAAVAAVASAIPATTL